MIIKGKSAFDFVNIGIKKSNSFYTNRIKLGMIKRYDLE